MNQLLRDKVIETIGKHGITPRPRWQFLLKSGVLWSCVACSMLLGGVAFAIIIFTFIDHDATTRAYLHGTVFEYALETIPYFWLMTLVLLIGITQYAVRQTAFGYRYTTWRIVSFALFGSVVFGIALQATETAERIQDFLTGRNPYYDARVDSSEDEWLHPEKGLLGGTVITLASPDEFYLLDFQGKTWLVDFSRVEQLGEGFTVSGSKVKIIGSPEDISTFRATKVLLWREGD